MGIAWRRVRHRTGCLRSYWGRKRGIAAAKAGRCTLRIPRREILERMRLWVAARELPRARRCGQGDGRRIGGGFFIFARTISIRNIPIFRRRQRATFLHGGLLLELMRRAWTGRTYGRSMLWRRNWWAGRA